MRAVLPLLFLLLVATTTVQAQQAVTTNSKPNVYALVIGISSYFDKDIPQLQFANRDAEVFAEYLKSKAGGSVPEENITLLVDSAATTAAVYNAIYELKQQCQKDDLVYFYFSGHGDLENTTMFKNGFFICYDSPPNNYVRLALSIEYLNDIATTLSAETNANVILITDACHSGKLAGSKFKGNFLVGDQLRAVRKKEIRITACATDQLSNENEAWGGGRGVFSWYLIKGLKGQADIQKDGIVTAAEIKKYLASSLAKDPTLKREHILQTPVLNGNDNFQLAIVDTTVANEVEKEMAVSSSQFAVGSGQISTAEELPAQPQQYFFALLKKERLEALTDSLHLAELNSTDIPFVVIKRIKDSLKNIEGQNKLAELEQLLRTDKDVLKRFNGKLAISFDEAGQKVIDQYLKGDEAELERRRYYNSRNNGYDVYPKMFAVALKLTQPDNYLYNILQVKLHYFSGVALRLKIPTVENQSSLIEKALAEQNKALALEEHAAYIYNEMGVLFAYKKNYTKAEEYYIKATEISPEWVVPWSNLSGLYAGRLQFEKGIAAVAKAKELNPGLQSIYVNSAYLYEKKQDLLQAEELYRKSIYINSRHFLPFERLAYVNMNTTRYADADSFFFEADIRKKGFHFIPEEFPGDKELITPTVGGPGMCLVDSIDVGPNDVLGHFALGINATETFVVSGIVNADGVVETIPTNIAIGERAFKKVIELDKSNPLAFHYLGKMLYWQHRWAEADILFNLAVKYHLDSSAFQYYLDSMSRLLPPTPSKECIIKTFADFQYAITDDHYYLASLYEEWHHYTEAEAEYRKIISLDPINDFGYYKLWNLLESIGRYHEAEEVIRSFIEHNLGQKQNGENELHAFYNRVLKVYPDDAEWNHKAGLFLYHLAADHPDDYPYDKKTVKPDSYEEVFTMPDQKIFSFHVDAQYLPGPWKVHPDGWMKSVGIDYPRNEGIACLLKADSLSTYPDETVADINDKIGDLYTWQGLPGRAIRHYNKSLSLQPENAGVRMKLIEVNDITYHYQDAFVQLDSLNGRKGMNFSKMLLMAKYKVHAGKFADAQQWLDSAKKIHPYKMAEIIDLNGRLQLLSEKLKPALDFYEKLLTFDEKDSIVLYSIARLNAKMGNNTEAWKWLDAALKNGFNYSFVLKYDPYMNGLRGSAKWNAIFNNYHMKVYPLPESKVDVHGINRPI